MEETVLLDAIERYLRGEMSQAEQYQFEQLRQSNAELDQLVVEQLFFLRQMDQYNDRNQFRAALTQVHEQLMQQHAIEPVKESQPAKVIGLWSKYKRTVAVAATIAGLISISVAGIVYTYTRKANEREIIDLRGKIKKNEDKIDNIEKNEAWKEAKAQEKQKARPNPNATYSGTGFLIDAKGWLITNEHVINGRRNLHIYNEKFGDLTAEVVYTDKRNDLAIVHITDTAFKSVKALPYSMRNADPELGETVFTLGYPRPPEIFYNEGFISARSATGTTTNENNFLLSLQVSEGNSGSPVFNNRGEIVGVINAREKNINGNAVAIKSAAVIQLIELLKKEDKSVTAVFPKKSAIGGQTRNKQLSKLESCIFMMELE